MSNTTQKQPGFGSLAQELPLSTWGKTAFGWTRQRDEDKRSVKQERNGLHPVSTGK